jgi:hypothetical protein
MRNSSLGLLAAIGALIGPDVSRDGVVRRGGGHQQPKKPRVNKPGTKAARKLAARIAKRNRRKRRGLSHPDARNAKPQTPKRRFRADVMLYLASIGKPQSGRQLVRFRRALRREERARALSSSPRQGGR